MRSIRKNLKTNKSAFRGGLFLFGAIVGIGIFALPYAGLQLGLFWGLAVLILAGLLAWLLNLAYAKLVLVSGDNCQLGNYGRRYWGTAGWLLGSLAVLVNINGALLAYLIGAGNFLHLLFLQLSPFLGGLIFLVIAFPVIALGLKLVARANEVLAWILIFLMVSFLSWGILHVNPGNFFVKISDGSGSLLQFFSVFFFSFTGFAVIPELAETLNFKPRSVYRAVELGSLLPIILYGLFVVVGLRILGGEVSEEFIFSLGKVSLIWARLLSVVALIAIAGSFFTFGFTLKEFWQQDFGFSKPLSLILTVLPPPLFYFFGSRNFLAVISFTGGTSCLLMGGLILACWLREMMSNRKNGQLAKHNPRINPKPKKLKIND
ncbi:MAG: aromatic amino acid transport family protein [Candidatus Shapirobacteria bacterium]|nr:aromatic amino acid transport family protein [Candidatus Shapirobacteria bacterium]MDD5073878.1 aromatic amino acid transport family protein [Candidatus Shapirobacteria bacterium]